MTFLAAFELVDVLRSALIFAALLVPLVVIHEFGHFFAAKLFRIKVLEFGIGFPPRIKGLSFRRGETEYTINWLPIGGFVRMLGERRTPPTPAPSPPPAPGSGSPSWARAWS